MLFFPEQAGCHHHRAFQKWGNRKGRTVLVVTGREQLDLRGGRWQGYPQNSGSLRQLGKCQGICWEVCPPLGFGVTDLEKIIELVFQNLDLQLKKIKVCVVCVFLNIVKFSQCQHLARSIWYRYGNRMREMCLVHNVHGIQRFSSSESHPRASRIF